MKYEGQKQTCGFYAETGHNEKDCERKYQLKLFKIGSKREITPKTTTVKAGPTTRTNDTAYKNEQRKRSCKTTASLSCDQLETNNEQSVQRSTSRSQSPKRQICDFCAESGHNEKNCKRKQHFEFVKSARKLKMH